MSIFFFLNDTATTEIYTLSLHDALPISTRYLIDPADHFAAMRTARSNGRRVIGAYHSHPASAPTPSDSEDRKSTRLNSSHVRISYAVFCLKKQKTTRAFNLYLSTATTTA